MCILLSRQKLFASCLSLSFDFSVPLSVVSPSEITLLAIKENPPDAHRSVAGLATPWHTSSRSRHSRRSRHDHRETRDGAHARWHQALHVSLLPARQRTVAGVAGTALRRPHGAEYTQKFWQVGRTRLRDRRT